MAVAGALPCRAGQRGHRGVELLGHEAGGGRRLQRRVVGQAQHRQRRGAVFHLAPADVRQAAPGRPLALLLAQVHPVRDDVLLLGIDQQAAGERVLGGREVLLDFQQAAQVVQRLQILGAVGFLVQLDGRAEDGAPHGQRFLRLALAFQQGAEIEPAFDTARLQRDALAVGRFGAGIVGIGRQQRAEVEPGRVQQRLARAVFDPAAVQRDGLLRLALLLQRGGGVEQLRDRHVAASRLFQPLGVGCAGAAHGCAASQPAVMSAG